MRIGGSGGGSMHGPPHQMLLSYKGHKMKRCLNVCEWANVACGKKRFEWSAGVEKPYMSTIPFTI